MDTVMSFGVCLLVYIGDCLFTLMVKKNSTYAACDILVGRYTGRDQLLTLLPKLTPIEHAELGKGYRALFTYIFGDGRIVPAHLTKYNTTIKHGDLQTVVPGGMLMYEWPKGTPGAKRRKVRGKNTNAGINSNTNTYIHTESPTQTAAREFKEETGMNLSHLGPINESAWFAYSNINRNTNTTYVAKLFVVVLNTLKELPPIPVQSKRNREIRTVCWVNFSELAANVQALIHGVVTPAC
jgi:hypothetical protein